MQVEKRCEKIMNPAFCNNNNDKKKINVNRSKENIKLWL